MRNAIAFVLLLTCLLPLQACAIQPNTPKQQKQTIIHFPTTNVGEDYIVAFEIENTAEKEIVIKSVDVDGSTDGVSVAAPILPFPIKTGASTTLGIHFTPHAAGNYEAKITVTFDTDGIKPIVLIVKGHAVDPKLDQAVLKLTITPSFSKS